MENRLAKAPNKILYNSIIKHESLRFYSNLYKFSLFSTLSMENSLKKVQRRASNYVFTIVLLKMSHLATNTILSQG